MKNLLIFGGLGYVAYRIFKKIHAANNLIVSLERVNLSGSGFYPVIELTVRLSNNSDQSAVIKNFTGKILANGKTLIGNVFNIAGMYNIPAYGSTEITIPVNLFLPSLITSTFDYFKNKIQSVEFVGDVYVDSAVIPVTLKKEFING